MQEDGNEMSMMATIAPLPSTRATAWALTLDEPRTDTTSIVVHVGRTGTSLRISLDPTQMRALARLLETHADMSDEITRRFHDNAADPTMLLHAIDEATETIRLGKEAAR